MFTEYDDRYEATLLHDEGSVTLSVDKPIGQSDLARILDSVRGNINELHAEALAYFESRKHELGLGYIDDLSAPQFMASVDSLAIYWCSDKGEENGESIIGVGYSLPDFRPCSVTIGD